MSARVCLPLSALQSVECSVRFKHGLSVLPGRNPAWVKDWLVEALLGAG
eukprot:SAG31_NODE_1385_length_8573_cov_27.673118_9_plen_49_part_00